MQYPKKCIKGMPNESCFYRFEGSLVASMNLFCFPKNAYRPDGWIEESINWMDDKHAIDLTLNQRKESGELHFRVGIAIVPHTELNRIKKRYFSFLHYERRPEPGNPYHGNVLLNSNLTPSQKSHIKALLADIAEIKPREEIINQRWYIVVWCLIKRCHNFIFSSRK